MQLPVKYYICLLSLLYINPCFTQDSTKILIKADQLFSEVLTAEKIYQYPNFLRGKIIFRDQTVTEAPLNYNYLNGEIEFISATKDTMAIAKHQMLNIQQIQLNKDTFYYHDNGYLQQLLRTQLGVLAKRRTLVVSRREKIGAFGRPSTTINVESLAYFRDYYGSLTPNLKVNENITMAYKDVLFLGDKFNTFVIANKKNLIRLYPSSKAVINSYLNGNNVDFRNSEDLQKLLLILK